MSGTSAGPILPVVNIDVNYDEQREKIADFLEHFKAPAQQVPPLSEVGAMDAHGPTANAPSAQLDRLDTEDGMEVEDVFHSSPALAGDIIVEKYMVQLQRIANRDQDKLTIELDDIVQFRGANGASGASLAYAIRGNARQYLNLFYEVVDKLMPSPDRDISDKDDVLDVIRHQRLERNVVNEEHDENAGEVPDIFPTSLLRRYMVFLKPLSSDTPLAVRNIRGAQIGKLLSVRGIVTRISDVKPNIQVDAYACDVCGAEVFQEVTGRQFMPLNFCTSRVCVTNKIRAPLYPQARASKFVAFQDVRIQEMTDQVPVGHIPRTMTIHLYGRLTRSMTPGDIVDIGGIFLPVPFTGFRAIRAGLLTDTYLDAQCVKQLKKSYQNLVLTPEDQLEIEMLRSDPALYSRLAASIAPEIYGHEDVKKTLLLLLVGGCSKAMGDGLKIRGDLNVCLMGDPGVAKSQMLKYIAKVAPRGLYTTGRGSSSAGLTAAVLRDPVTNEMVLEGGALVLADNGIACIDEFDKMDEADRTAIHEVMEQQTISISKAGINTTLNARTSILAAANPLYGQYNPRISPVDNINLPAALLSRFDILYLILDKPSRDTDEMLAQHITYVHMFNQAPPQDHDVIPSQVLRHFIAAARQHRPVIPATVSDYIVSAYVQLRAQHKLDEERESAFTYTSARTLLGVIRLAQALARLRFASEVENGDVEEALRLMDVSKASLYTHNRRGDLGDDQTPVSKIFRILREMAAQAGAEETLGRRHGGAAGALGEVTMRDFRERVLHGGFVEDQLQETLQEYASLGVIQLVGNSILFL
ncbi:DNA helicase [Malassezia vespertilionis]|uniref:DNA replication licensing factor MCM7 n=3 Tax=Malassezia vespertilionis TaxID=2020962 RepID=A0A2N1JAJ3_9BASI|nr:DNA helicase [Malassezia vespertilionis]PKI83574.1 Mcm7p [Malassezia vespertilionis]WFD07458.1 DNA helicase [Malassezia vespertilionis]